MIVIFGFFVLPFFRKSKKSKTNVGNKTTFLLMMVIN